jgi:hypothetical protein
MCIRPSAIVRLALTMFMGVMLCACQSPRGNEPDEEWKEPVFHLKDIQGLFGGRDIYIYEDDTALVRLARHERRSLRLREKRFITRLPAGTVDRLHALARSSGFDAYRQTRKTGIPDEAYPHLYWRSPSGKEFQGNKWDGEKDAHFDPLYHELVSLADTAKPAAPRYHGNYDSEWRHGGTGQARMRSR